MLGNAWRTVRLLGLRGATVLGLLHMVIAFTPVLGWWTGSLSSKWGPDDGDILVVLGGDMAAPDLLGSSSYWRCFYATLVWRQGHFRRVIVSGRGAAPEMKAFLVSKRLPAEVILVENDSVSTRDWARDPADKRLPLAEGTRRIPACRRPRDRPALSGCLQANKQHRPALGCAAGPGGRDFEDRVLQAPGLDVS